MSISIFKRCTKCNDLALKDEKHTCKPKERVDINFIQEAYEVLRSAEEPLDQSEVSRAINKKLGNQRCNQFIIAYYMRHKPDVFVETSKFHFALKERNTEA